MPSYLSSIDYIALILYAVYLGSAVSGVWILRRSSSKRRFWGLASMIESLGVAALLTLMGSENGGAGRKGIIAIGVTAVGSD
jgi:hypothetical protein